MIETKKSNEKKDKNRYEHQKNFLIDVLIDRGIELKIKTKNTKGGMYIRSLEKFLKESNDP